MDDLPPDIQKSSLITKFPVLPYLSNYISIEQLQKQIKAKESLESKIDSYVDENLKKDRFKLETESLLKRYFDTKKPPNRNKQRRGSVISIDSVENRVTSSSIIRRFLANTILPINFSYFYQDYAILSLAHLVLL